MRFLDFLSLIYIPIGFLLGLAILLLLDLFGLGFWARGGILLLALLPVFAWQYVADALSLNRLFASKREREMMDRMDARDRRIGRYAVALGMLIAFGATLIWTPLAISEALP